MDIEWVRSALVTLPEAMREDLEVYLDSDLPFVAEMVEKYLSADEDGKADMAAFHDCAGVARVQKFSAKIERAVPLPEELQAWFEGDCYE